MGNRKWYPGRAGRGTVLQSGIPKEPLRYEIGLPRGLLVRGVVVATYLLDDPSHPHAGEDPATIYCDVLVYGATQGLGVTFLPRCLVAQDRSGLHSGRVWKPKAATIDVSGNTFDPDKATNPAYMDGDHVLLGFLEDDISRPVILGSLPHPTADTGNETRDAGHRLRLKSVDGDPDFWKHHGAYYGITDAGDFVVDTTRANDGQISDQGLEPEPPGDGSVGNYQVRLPAGATVTVSIDGGASLTIAEKDGNAVLTLGDGAKNGVIYDALESVFDGHTHPTGVGPSGPPTPLMGTAQAAKSSKLLIPDG